MLVNSVSTYVNLQWELERLPIELRRSFQIKISHPY